jgi:bacterioferritin (cytochrome b1)
MNTLIENLKFVYFVIKASEHLLETAIEVEQSEVLKDYFRHHLLEERDHAKWLAEDLKTIGIDMTKKKAPFSAATMAGVIYYRIFHEDPAALLGYMLVLENSRFPIRDLEDLERIHGKELLRTLRHHVEHDSQHSQDLLKIIESLDEKRQISVKSCANDTALFHANCMREIYG